MAKTHPHIDSPTAQQPTEVYGNVADVNDYRASIEDVIRAAAVLYSVS